MTYQESEEAWKMACFYWALGWNGVVFLAWVVGSFALAQFGAYTPENLP